MRDNRGEQQEEKRKQRERTPPLPPQLRETFQTICNPPDRSIGESSRQLMILSRDLKGTHHLAVCIETKLVSVSLRIIPGDLPRSTLTHSSPVVNGDSSVQLSRNCWHLSTCSLKRGVRTRGPGVPLVESRHIDLNIQRGSRRPRTGLRLGGGWHLDVALDCCRRGRRLGPASRIDRGISLGLNRGRNLTRRSSGLLLAGRFRDTLALKMLLKRGVPADLGSTSRCRVRDGNSPTGLAESRVDQAGGQTPGGIESGVDPGLDQLAREIGVELLGLPVGRMPGNQVKPGPETTISLLESVFRDAKARMHPHRNVIEGDTRIETHPSFAPPLLDI